MTRRPPFLGPARPAATVYQLDAWRTCRRLHSAPAPARRPSWRPFIFGLVAGCALVCAALQVGLAS